MCDVPKVLPLVDQRNAGTSLANSTAEAIHNRYALLVFQQYKC